MVRRLNRRASDSHIKKSLALFFIPLLLFASCRKELPVEAPIHGIAVRFTPGSYYSYANWLLSYGYKDPHTQFRTSWTVLDTGKVLRGRSNVTVIRDSTFGTDGRFVRADSLLFSCESNGDLYQYAFLSNLIATRESLSIAPQWERIAAFSVPTGSSWIVARLDTSNGLRQPQTVFGEIQTEKEYIAVTLNGSEQAILTYRLCITKPKLDYTFWISEIPGAVVRVLDDSEVLDRTALRELVSARLR
jgi:hypothetical protein